MLSLFFLNFFIFFYMQTLCFEYILRIKMKFDRNTGIAVIMKD